MQNHKPSATHKPKQATGQDMTLYLLIVKFEPLLGGRADVGIVVASVDATTVHQDTVQLVQVAHTAVCSRGQELAIIHI